jgi:hypothetical protein
MKPNYRLPDSGRKESLSAIIDEIVKIAHPEKIFLIGASYEYQLTENIFIKNPVENLTGRQYDLLIISDTRERISGIENETLFYTKFKHRAGLHIRLMDIHEFNKAVKAGNDFENFILLNAMLCYDKGKILMEDPVKMND